LILNSLPLVRVMSAWPSGFSFSCSGSSRSS
jgi:hypothetical protein